MTPNVRKPGHRTWLVFSLGIIAGAILLILGNRAVEYTSTDNFCAACHVHPHATSSWKLSTHHDNQSGITVHCAECHLPPHGDGYLREKIRLGAKDIWGKMTKDTSEFNWDGKRSVEVAQHFTYKTSCIKCHDNLFPLTLSKDGENAHLYYTQNKDDLHCINCHLQVGHYDPRATHDQNLAFGLTSEEKEIYTEPATVDSFIDFTEYIPQSSVSFNMKAIPGGTFTMGSPANEPFRKEDEGPAVTIEVNSFYMAEIEVSWDEYLAFYSQTAAEGRSTDTEGARKNGQVDGISGATPPYGQPDQNWGLSKRPAITMSFHAAETYCKWLSTVTGKKYRLPTEAEWEYAARGGTQTPYFFAGSPKKYETKGFWNKLFGPDTTVINTYVIYVRNSQMMTQMPDRVAPNPFGLKNMLGNVAEFCSDWYSPTIYSQYNNQKVSDPKGPESGTEHVVRGGSFKSDAGEVRAASRDFTHTDAWLKTDPQMPKSIWWYSDVRSVGFRVICEFDPTTGKPVPYKTNKKTEQQTSPN